MGSSNIQIQVSKTIGNVSGELTEPSTMKYFLVLAHGAGAGMKHRFMVSLSDALAALNIGSLRYNFPYVERGKKMPDPPAIAEKTVEAAVHETIRLFPNIKVFAGGKSFGGRMTSQYMAKQPANPVSGIVFFGFPLHAPGKPGTERAAHLEGVKVPMLFHQGTKDTLAQLDLIESVCSKLSTATLRKYEGADHSFKVGKKEFIDDLARHTLEWCQTL